MSDQEFNPENVQWLPARQFWSECKVINASDYDRLLALYNALQATHEAELRRTVTALQGKQIAQLERLAEENVAAPAMGRREQDVTHAGGEK